MNQKDFMRPNDNVNKELNGIGAAMENRKIRMGMVGGGRGAFIGEVHREAALMDGQIELVCGAFSMNAERSRESGKDYYLPDDRVYGSYQEMFEKEKALPDDKKMDFVAIVTPNHVHFPVAKAALENGFHVVCEKPLTVTADEAEELARLVKETGLQFAVTHTYTGYPMVKQARDMARGGQLGAIRKIVVEYPQGWLSTFLESENKQASWRTDPKQSGPAGALGDIGTHAENLAEYISGLKITEICADISTMVEKRKLDDDVSVLLRFDNGAKGILHASQICAGEENALRIYVYGEKGGLEWHQQEPNTLIVKQLDGPAQIYRAGANHGGYLSSSAMYNTRVPGGHPEGYIEAFANIYRNVASTLRAVSAGRKPTPDEADFPSVEDGLRGMRFVEAVIASSNSRQKWTPFK
ncbi:Gfo/Idh/MocA family oxidoreductase [Balneolaceae bacterium ANBcel3]|nr:Gfo/Idh/MocA family oxidoreductase [Balneolaceae bacterium ANBcel3]